MMDETFTDKNIDRLRNLEHNNFFEYLSTAYEVLRKILSYLPLEDLKTLSEAVEKWRPIIKRTIKERTFIETYVFSKNRRHCRFWNEGYFCLTFLMTESQSMESKLKRHLAEDAEFLVIKAGAGIIGTVYDLSEVLQHRKFRFKIPVPLTPNVTHIRVPKMPDVGIKILTWKASIKFQDFVDNFSLLIGNQIVKCMLIFIASQDNSKASKQKDHFVTFVQSQQSESFAVGGCTVDSFIDSLEEDPEAITKYIIFYGDKVEGSSTLLDKNVGTKELVDFKVQKLKQVSPKTKKGILFVCSCCGRHQVFEDRETQREICRWEKDSLVRHFPETPIIGCFGYGEFGREHPNLNSDSNVIKRRNCDNIWEYSFTTSIVYVGFKE